MKYNPLHSSVYIRHRNQLREHLNPGALVILHSNDIPVTNADGTLPFVQNSDMLYLTGVDQEETILVLFPDAQDLAHREILFVKETSETIAIWEGDKLTKTQATDRTGISTVYWTKDYSRVMKALLLECSAVYLNNNEHTRANRSVQTREDRLNSIFREAHPNHTILRLAPLLQYLRSKKSPEEIEQMQIACNITEKGFRRILNYTKPGVMEYQLEAEFLHEFMMNRSRRFAYTPIVASGKNACVLHYIENHAECKDGDVILFDVGAEYGNYCADMSRSIPVNGRFSKRQRSVYDAVLRVMKTATSLLTPGTMLAEYHKAVGELMEKELVDLGLISMNDIASQDASWPAYKKYFMHGTSHFIGLDVHDVGHWSKPLEANMCFTVEPGIYIPEEGLGIRLENDVVVQTTGAPLDLMANIPLEAEEIESLMNS